MDDKIPVQKYYERDQFTLDEKFEIRKKSGGLCSHCGKEIYAGYTMTVDHFIPLFKGGSNRQINLIPLCEDCNKEKDSKIYPISYCKYLKDKPKKILSDYLESYIAVTDYVQRHRLLAYDIYDLDVFIPSMTATRKKKNKNTKSRGIMTKYQLKLATWDDFDKLYDYFIKYLKKYKSLVDEEYARENLSFWMQFGCIYYIEMDGHIDLMTAITIKHLSATEDFRGINNQPYMYVFSYYNTELALNILIASLYDIPSFIIKENNLTFTPINILFLEKDNKKDIVASCYNSEPVPDVVDMFVAFHVIIGHDTQENSKTQTYDEMNENEKEVYNFYKKFDNVTDKLVDYFKEYTHKENTSWMMHCLFSVDIIKTIDGLSDMLSVNTNENEENINNED